MSHILWPGVRTYPELQCVYELFDASQKIWKTKSIDMFLWTLRIRCLCFTTLHSGRRYFLLQYLCNVSKICFIFVGLTVDASRKQRLNVYKVVVCHNVWQMLLENMEKFYNPGNDLTLLVSIWWEFVVFARQDITSKPENMESKYFCAKYFQRT